MNTLHSTDALFLANAHLDALGRRPERRRAQRQERSPFLGPGVVG